MRWLAIVCSVLLVGCASVAPPSPPGLPGVMLRGPDPVFERPWLTQPTDEIKIFDTRTLQALRKLDELPALNQNGGERRVKVGLWVGVGIVALPIVVNLIDHIGQEIFDCLFGDDCEGEGN